ncbi:MAG: DUF3617 domain-containing protein [Sphingosinicella sp.]
MQKTIAAMAMALAACGSQPGNQQAAADGDAAGGGGSAAIALQAGLWEVTAEMVSMNISGMPPGVTPPMAPPTTIRNCLTPEQARAPNADFFSGKSEGGCTGENMSFGGGRIQGTIRCETPQGTMQIAMDGSYDATSYQMTQRIEGQMAGQSVNMENRVSARRVGDCPA